ncbi:hypothetical protein Avbf_15894 [Armadillidium vulgare]|nr:hypothetical protein Avbf_15894 [Armadillidium vulgare]
MDIKQEIEIKDEIFESIEEQTLSDFHFVKVPQLDEMLEKNHRNIDVKGEIETKNEPLDIKEEVTLSEKHSDQVCILHEVQQS